MVTSPRLTTQSADANEAFYSESLITFTNLKEQKKHQNTALQFSKQTIQICETFI